MRTKFEGINIGCGNDIKEDFINIDKFPLKGVDISCSFEANFLPFKDNLFSRVYAYNILEHIDNLINIMEEIWRVTKKDALINIRVPYWNSIESITDPTHKRFFNESTFTFFDPNHPRGKLRSYYSKAKFRHNEIIFIVDFFGHRRVKNRILKSFFSRLANKLCHIIVALEIELITVK